MQMWIVTRASNAHHQNRINKARTGPRIRLSESAKNKNKSTKKGPIKAAGEALFWSRYRLLV